MFACFRFLPWVPPAFRSNDPDPNNETYQKSGGTEHPLQNEIILKCVFKNLGVQDLKSCRQVCKIWLEISGRAMKSCVYVLVSSNRFPERCRQSKVLKLVEAKRSTFYAAPYVENFRIYKPIPDGKKLWKISGSQMKSLTLVEATFKSPKAFLHSIVHSCPNLVELTLEFCTITGRPSQEPAKWAPLCISPNKNLRKLTIVLSSGWTDILYHIPGLQELRMGSLYADDALDEHFESLGVVWRHGVSHVNLKKLEFHLSGLAFPLKLIPIFSGNNLVLETMKIHGIYRNEDVTTLQNILIAQATSLKHLWLQGVSKLESIFPLPKYQTLENLVELNLNWSWSSYTLSTLEFLRTAPNLQRVQLSVDGFAEIRNMSYLNWFSKPCNLKCKELSLSYRNGISFHSGDSFGYPISAGVLKSLGRWLPNLEKLEMDCIALTNKTFALVCEFWPNLKFLNVTNSTVDDSGFSGFDKADVKTINRLGADPMESNWKPITVRRANLSSLKNLESFSWRTRGDILPGRCTALYGVLELQKLKHLRMECKDKGSPWRKILWNSLMVRFPWKDDRKPFH